MLEGFQEASEALEASMDDDLAKANAKVVEADEAKQRLAEELGAENRRLMEEVDEGKKERQRLMEEVEKGKDEKRGLIEEVEKGKKEKRGLQDVISGLERDNKASHVSLERLTKASQDANGTIQHLQDREKEHRMDNWRLFSARREAEAKVRQAVKEQKAWLVEEALLKTSQKRAQRKAKEAWGEVDVVRGEVAQLAQAKAAVEGEVRNLRTANRLLGAKKEHYKRKSSSALAELDGWKTSSEDLTAELGRVRGRLTECEATNSSEAEKIRQLDMFVDERLEAFVQWKEGLRRAAANRPLFPRWFVVVMVWFLFGLMVVSALAVRRQKQMWMGAGYGATHYTRWSSESSWEDPEMDLSRGMYGG